MQADFEAGHLIHSLAYHSDIIPSYWGAWFSSYRKGYQSSASYQSTTGSPEGAYSYRDFMWQRPAS